MLAEHSRQRFSTGNPSPEGRKPSPPATSRQATLGAGLRLALAALLGAAELAGAGGVPLRFERISIEHGLSQSTANSIVQDSLGFLWIGTQDGPGRRPRPLGPPDRDLPP